MFLINFGQLKVEILPPPPPPIDKSWIRPCCPCIYIQRDGIRSRREMAAWESLASQGRRREPGRQPPGVLHVSRDPWGCLEVALRAPWDYRRITVRLPLTITRCPSDFPLIMTFKIVREPSGPPVTLRCPYGPSTAYSATTGCLRPGTLENPGYRTEMTKITVFTRRTGPLMDMWQPHNRWNPWSKVKVKWFNEFWCPQTRVLAW